MIKSSYGKIHTAVISFLTMVRLRQVMVRFIHSHKFSDNGKIKSSYSKIHTCCDKFSDNGKIKASYGKIHTA